MKLPISTRTFLPALLASHCILSAATSAKRGIGDRFRAARQHLPRWSMGGRSRRRRGHDSHRRLVGRADSSRSDSRSESDRAVVPSRLHCSERMGGRRAAVFRGVREGRPLHGGVLQRQESRRALRTVHAFRIRPDRCPPCRRTQRTGGARAQRLRQIRSAWRGHHRPDDRQCLSARGQSSEEPSAIGWASAAMSRSRGGRSTGSPTSSWIPRCARRRSPPPSKPTPRNPRHTLGSSAPQSSTATRRFLIFLRSQRPPTARPNWRRPGPIPFYLGQRALRRAGSLGTLRTELVSSDGKILDRVFTRFGFREVWLSGQDVMLNGRKLWMAGAYHGKHSALRDLNDRRPMAAMTSVMRSAGLNTLHGHWDDLGRNWLDLCDETGMFVVAGFSCDGRPQIQSKADAGWADWMTATCTEWVRARRNHPSILVWRPTDVGPSGIERFISLDDFHAAIAAEVRKHDPAHRPIADGSDIAAWGQPPEDRATGEYTNFAPLQAGHDSGKPFMCKEIYGGFNSPDKYLAFSRGFYKRSFDLGSTRRARATASPPAQPKHRAARRFVVEPERHGQPRYLPAGPSQRAAELVRPQLSATHRIALRDSFPRPLPAVHGRGTQTRSRGLSGCSGQRPVAAIHRLSPARKLRQFRASRLDDGVRRQSLASPASLPARGGCCRMRNRPTCKSRFQLRRRAPATPRCSVFKPLRDGSLDESRSILTLS